MNYRAGAGSAILTSRSRVKMDRLLHTAANSFKKGLWKKYKYFEFACLFKQRKLQGQKLDRQLSTKLLHTYSTVTAKIKIGVFCWVVVAFFLIGFLIFVDWSTNIELFYWYYVYLRATVHTSFLFRYKFISISLRNTWNGLKRDFFSKNGIFRGFFFKWVFYLI